MMRSPLNEIPFLQRKDYADVGKTSCTAAAKHQ